MLFTVLGIMGIEKVYKALNTQANKNNCNEYGLYVDGNGNYRLKFNNHWVVDTYNEYGEHIIKNVKTGITEVNIDKIESDKRKENAIRNHEQFYLLLSDKQQPKYLGNRTLKGDRFIEISTNKMLTKRIIHLISNNKNDNVRYVAGEFYMDMNYNIYAPTSETKKYIYESFGDSYEDVIKFIMDCANSQINLYSNKGMFYDANNIIKIDKSLDDAYKKASRTIKNWR